MKTAKYLFQLIIFIICTVNLSANTIPHGFIEIDSSNNTTLKVSTKSLYVNDIYDRFNKVPKMYVKHPELIKPSNDSSYLKKIRGIIIENAILYRIDDSFFELRRGDSLESISIRETKFDYDHLIQNIIKNNIKLKHLGISLQYLDSFPDNINKIEGLKWLDVDFMKKNIEIDKELCNSQNIELLILRQKNRINSSEYISKLINLKDLSIYDSDSIYFSDEIINSTNLSYLTINSCNFMGNTLKNISDLTNLVSLTLEDCCLSDNKIDIQKLKNLKFLDLRYNRFKKFPEAILSLKELQCFYFEGNRITDIPFELIMKLPPRLERLYITIASGKLDFKTITFYIDNKEALYLRNFDFHISSITK